MISETKLQKLIDQSNKNIDDLEMEVNKIKNEVMTDFKFQGVQEKWREITRDNLDAV